MRRWITGFALSCAVAVASCGQHPAANASSDWRAEMKQVRFAVRGSESDPAIATQWSVYRDYLSKAIGLPVKLYESSDYNGAIQALSSGQVDTAWPT